MTEEPICNRCGSCCKFFADGQMRKCKNLVTLPSGKTTCRIYAQKNRVGSVIYTDKQGKKFTCNKIEDVKLNFIGCPFNKEKNTESGW